jgi:hypothetical protein
MVGKTELAKENIRLIFKGRILKDEQSLTEAKLENGVTVVLVQSSDSKGTGPYTAVKEAVAKPAEA